MRSGAFPGLARGDAERVSVGMGIVAPRKPRAAGGVIWPGSGRSAVPEARGSGPIPAASVPAHPSCCADDASRATSDLRRRTRRRNGETERGGKVLAQKLALQILRVLPDPVEVGLGEQEIVGLILTHLVGDFHKVVPPPRPGDALPSWPGHAIPSISHCSCPFLGPHRYRDRSCGPRSPHRPSRVREGWPERE